MGGAAAVPMGLLAWVFAPLLRDQLGGREPLAESLLILLTLGPIWQFVLVVILLRRELGRDDDTEFVAAEDMPEQSSFRGPEGYRQFLASMLDVFEEFRSEPERIVELGDEKYLVTERFQRKTDATAVEAHNFALISMRGEKLRRLQVFLDRRTALHAAGLSEEAVRVDRAL